MTMRDDVRDVTADGRTDGLVNSDNAYDDVRETLAGRSATTTDVAQVAARARAQVKADLDEAVARSDATTDTLALIMHPDGNPARGRRPQAETDRLVKAYLDAWQDGFQSRLSGSSLRSDLADEVEVEVATQARRTRARY